MSDAEHVMTWILTLFHYTIASLHCEISLRKPLFPIVSQNENNKEYSQENKPNFFIFKPFAESVVFQTRNFDVKSQLKKDLTFEKLGLSSPLYHLTWVRNVLSLFRECEE